MIKEEVIEKIDELRSLFTKIQDILQDYDNIISVYSENNLKFSYEDCEYWKNQLADAKQNIMNYWQSSDNNYEGDDTELHESVDNSEINSQVLQELYDLISENYGDDWLSDYDEIDFNELQDAVYSFGNEIDGYEDYLRDEYAMALKNKWREEHRNDEINECLRAAGVILNEAEDDILELDEYEEDNELENARNEIYATLMNNSQLFRTDFGGQFDSDDDINYEISKIVKRVKNGQPIEYVQQVSPVFNEKLTKMVKKYIDLGGQDIA